MQMNYLSDSQMVFLRAYCIETIGIFRTFSYSIVFIIICTVTMECPIAFKTIQKIKPQKGIKIIF